MYSDAEDRKRKNHRIRTMNVVNVVELFIVVWSFSAACQGSDDDVSVSCDYVTGSVGKEVTLSCSVSLKITGCCITKYKFLYPEIFNDSSICQDVSKNSCEQRNSFTCHYTPTTVMTEQFRFFVQTTCGAGQSKFSVNIKEPIVRERVTEALGKKEPVWGISERDEQKKPEGRGFKIAVIAAVISCFIIVIMPIIYRLTQKYTNQNRTQSVRYEEDEDNRPEKGK
ncbi:uncharacterized protein LOC113088269 isoform X2 [Carassius auratus]|uniref:Uncharacterized protein LOC113088269 isoform X2 n=1 Tax=Carassius auratus TaxID=7957 RepID=A0A6P6NRE5_CARAU|nr:uncharacterized protein LOC113088269 isoform X2 [Carassius auratus]